MTSVDPTLNSTASDLPRLGWQERVRLPDLGLPWMKAKVDTGARTSALHAYDLQVIERDGRQYVRFKVHPRQHNFERVVETEAELVDQRHVRSSAGRLTFRPVIRTILEVADQRVPIEVTLICRKKLKFRMLIGREALQGRFLVDSEKTYLGKKSKPKKRKAETQYLLTAEKGYAIENTCAFPK